MQIQPQLIPGDSFTDERGMLRYVNALNLLPVKRFYIITHSNTETVRAWQGHKIESKWFYVLKGGFDFALLKPDNWENPSPQQELHLFTLTSADNHVLYVPGGYVNGFKALNADSELLVFSDATLEESVHDQYRFDSSLWHQWH